MGKGQLYKEKLEYWKLQKQVAITTERKTHCSKMIIKLTRKAKHPELYAGY